MNSRIIRDLVESTEHMTRDQAREYVKYEQFFQQRFRSVSDIGQVERQSTAIGREPESHSAEPRADHEGYKSPQ